MNDSRDFSKLSDEVILNHLLKLDINDLKNMCKSNKRVATVCKRHEDQIYQNLLHKDFGEWVGKPKLLYHALKSPALLNKQEHNRMLAKILLNSDTNSLYSLVKHYGFDINSVINIDGQPTLLEIAVDMQDIRLVNALLDLGVDVNKCSLHSNSPATHMLSYTNGMYDTETLLKVLDLNYNGREMLPTGYPVFNTLMLNETLSPEVVNKLLSLDFDINARDHNNATPLCILLRTKNIRKVSSDGIDHILNRGPNLNIADLEGKTVLMLLMKRFSWQDESYKLTEGLLQRPYNINIQDAHGNTALIYALRKREFPSRFIMQMLGADPPPDINMLNEGSDSAFSTLLDSMSTSGESLSRLDKVFKRMLVFHPNMNIGDSLGETPLMKCIHNAFPTNITKQVLNLTTDLNLTDTHGMTPLMLAIQNGTPIEIVELIMNKPQNFNIQDNEGCTALMYAFKFNGNLSESILTFLIDNSDLSIKTHINEPVAKFALRYIKNPFINVVIQKLRRRGADMLSGGATVYFVTNEFIEPLLFRTILSNTTT